MRKFKKRIGHRSALIAPKGVPVVSKNNSALGKDLASHSTDWNRGQNYRGIVALEDVDIFSTLKLGVHNINGIKNNTQRLQEVCDYGKRQNINIIGLVETNISVKEAKFIEIEDTKYHSHWSSAEVNKRKGSGVGILIEKEWNKHLTKVVTPNPYMIGAVLTFKKVAFKIWIIYLPPNDDSMKREIQRLLMKDIATAKANLHFIIGGDFNKILDPELDTANQDPKQTIKKLPLTKWVEKLGFVESFRYCNPKTKKFTWSNGRSKTRIDHIWISKELRMCAKQSDIEDMCLVSGSDHNLVWLTINTYELLRYKKKTRNKESIPKR